MDKVCIDETGEIEKELLEQTIGSLFNYLHYKLDKRGNPVRLTIMYLDVVFEISCQEVPEKIVPRGYK